MTSASTRRVILVALLLLTLAGSAASYSYNSFDSGTQLSIPEYDSQGEVASELIAPFIAIAVVLQFGLYRALSFTIDESNNPLESSTKEKARLRKMTLVMSLVITAMLVPSPYWAWIRTAFQGITFLAVGGLALAVLLVIYHMLGFAGDGNAD